MPTSPNPEKLLSSFDSEKGKDLCAKYFNAIDKYESNATIANGGVEPKQATSERLVSPAFASKVVAPEGKKPSNRRSLGVRPSHTEKTLPKTAEVLGERPTTSPNEEGEDAAAKRLTPPGSSQLKELAAKRDAFKSKEAPVTAKSIPVVKTLPIPLKATKTSEPDSKEALFQSGQQSNVSSADLERAPEVDRTNVFESVNEPKVRVTPKPLGGSVINKVAKVEHQETPKVEHQETLKVSTATPSTKLESEAKSVKPVLPKSSKKVKKAQASNKPKSLLGLFITLVFLLVLVGFIAYIFGSGVLYKYLNTPEAPLEPSPVPIEAQY